MTDLYTGRLVRLAAMQPAADAPALARWRLDTEYFRLSDDAPAYPQLAAQAEKDQAERPPNLYDFAIRTLDTDQLIGGCGVWVMNWASREGWVGIGVGERAFWGRGYGTEAMQLLLRYAFTQLNLARVSLMVYAYNLRALKSYLRCGFVEEGRVRHDCRRNGEYFDAVSMGILRDEWAGSGASAH